MLDLLPSLIIDFDPLDSIRTPAQRALLATRLLSGFALGCHSSVLKWPFVESRRSTRALLFEAQIA